MNAVKVFRKGGKTHADILLYVSNMIIARAYISAQTITELDAIECEVFDDVKIWDAEACALVREHILKKLATEEYAFIVAGLM